MDDECISPLQGQTMSLCLSIRQTIMCSVLHYTILLHRFFLGMAFHDLLQALSGLVLAGMAG